MIRIDLLHGHRRGRRWILVAAALLALAAVVFGLGMADRARQGGEPLFASSWDRVFRRRAAPSEQAAATARDQEPAAPSRQPGPAGPAPEGVALAPAVEHPAAPQTSPAASPPEEPAAGRPVAAASAASPTVPPPGKPAAVRPLTATLPEHGAVERTGQRGACGQLLHLGVRLAAPLRLGALACADTQYQVEGSTPAVQVDQLHALLDSLRHLPSQASLSLWRGGAAGEAQPYRFAFRGRLPDPGPPVPEPQTAEAAAALFGRVAQWVRRAGLELMAVEGLPSRGAAGGLTQQRQRIRVMGSLLQLGTLADSLRRVEPRLGLEELVLAEVFQREQEAPRLQLTAVLQALVQAPASLP